ncbi:toluene tolerance protein [Acidiferrobacter sp. SPIII_3]|jgi:phospholipid transport system substrate-binding protein|uniref:MlaC/ttg2D family ABC transporter substrate-binding protein n=1 Tax=Acidiferrobacter sp. SPIII_3 TaxID=1281578 RepID=UPI000D7263D9|nr:ABC transporter substrate-binding protein [Acidiferrobacter sp. SPIII_3]AWP22455.1 toluene tolerance protein [Acidiferrobacter sp. SPIII_3]
MTLTRRYAGALILLGCLMPAWVWAAITPSTPPNVIVHEKTNVILHLIEQKRAVYDHNKAALYAMVDKEVVPYFDFRRMSRWVLARYWRTATPAQRAAFTTQFRDLLVRTYATALLSYSGQRIAYLPYRAGAGSRHAMVKTMILENNGSANIPLDYMFVHKKAGWKVYDVTIDNVSLVTNYRSVYGGKIRRHGLNALIASLKRANGGVS